MNKTLKDMAFIERVAAHEYRDHRWMWEELKRMNGEK